MPSTRKPATRNKRSVAGRAIKFALPAGSIRLFSARPTNWLTMTVEARANYVMTFLVQIAGYPVNGAAGIVGNLWAESDILPNRIEGSLATRPMRAPDRNRIPRDFTPQEVMDRIENSRGPLLAGIGIAQWTLPSRRANFFKHSYAGRAAGAAIIDDMDAQIDFLVAELGSRSFSSVDKLLRDKLVTLNDASDEVVYNFEVPGAILFANNTKKPRGNQDVQKVFAQRRKLSTATLNAYQSTQPILAHILSSRSKKVKRLRV